MKDKIWALIFAICIGVIGYILVSSAAAHTAKDNAAMIQWRYEHAVR